MSNKTRPNAGDPLLLHAIQIDPPGMRTTRMGRCALRRPALSASALLGWLPSLPKLSGCTHSSPNGGPDMDLPGPEDTLRWSPRIGQAAKLGST
jgi:hypothetical protein